MTRTRVVLRVWHATLEFGPYSRQEACPSVSDVRYVECNRVSTSSTSASPSPIKGGTSG